LLPAVIQKEDAMKTLCSFLVKFASIISWSLSCFDRVIFKGHLPISRPFQMENFIDYTLKIRRYDFFKGSDRFPAGRLGGIGKLG
jgi:hypothetical protein